VPNAPALVATRALDLRGDVTPRDRRACHLLPVELLLLLTKIDIELARVRVLANLPDRPRPPPARSASAQCRFDFARCACAADSRSLASESFPRADSIARPGRDTSREEHLLPASIFLAQPAIPSRLRRLPLQGAALFLDFEHDVVDAREVLLRGFELQFGRRAATCTW
jgi:hypothetical protein